MQRWYMYRNKRDRLEREIKLIESRGEIKEN